MSDGPTPEQIEAAFAREEHEAEQIAEAEAADAERAQPGVGFVGCHAGRGRVLRVRVANRSRKQMRVECPHGCGEHVTSASMARGLRVGEPEPELVELPPLSPAPGEAGSSNRRVTDGAIFDAIPVGGEGVAAGEVAEALGYAVSNSGGKATALMGRLRRMNKRAETRGEAPPFAFTRRQVRGGSKSIFVSRNPAAGAVPCRHG